MKIGIISDLHGYPEQFKKAINILKGSDMILCAGDILYHGPRNPILEGYDPQKLAEEIKNCKIPMLISRGNCDADVDMAVLSLPVFSPIIIYEKDNIRFVVMHGEIEEDKIKNIARIYKADIMVTGHTHIRKCEPYFETLMVNPGSPSVPKGDGIPSIAVFEDGEIKFINVNNGNTIERYYL
ncbi:MAG TPA: phosphodiesterase [Clostridiaceae bacterium]|jgi:hypothetical protein|nr:phosphodiesterase [Clostridiaceae bacterium]